MDTVAKQASKDKVVVKNTDSKKPAIAQSRSRLKNALKTDTKKWTPHNVAISNKSTILIQSSWYSSNFTYSWTCNFNQFS